MRKATFDSVGIWPRISKDAIEFSIRVNHRLSPSHLWAASHGPCTPFLLLRLWLEEAHNVSRSPPLLILTVEFSKAFSHAWALAHGFPRPQVAVNPTTSVLLYGLCDSHCERLSFVLLCSVQFFTVRVTDAQNGRLGAAPVLAILFFAFRAVFSLPRVRRERKLIRAFLFRTAGRVLPC
jgi:hypothetical protein